MAYEVDGGRVTGEDSVSLRILLWASSALWPRSVGQSRRWWREGLHALGPR